ncbi:MAG: transcriptional regulator NrdR [Patescibacteria group bacterium]|nr:transcriptional regulator NrdR [Patescibacteria group bacterium]
MKCPFCRQTNTEVYNTRGTKFGTQTWRRRRCLDCGQAFTTYEAPDLRFLKVAKSTGKPRSYSRAKLFSGLYAAFLDVPHKDETIDAVTDTIESKLLDLRQSQVSTQQIAVIVLSTLKHFNTAAFLRYLTTHTDLASPGQLARELKRY